MLWWLHGDGREQDTGSGRGTPDRVILAAAFALVVLVNDLTWGFGVTIARRLVSVVRVVDMYGDFLGPVVRCGQIKVWIARDDWRESKTDGREGGGVGNECISKRAHSGESDSRWQFGENPLRKVRS